MNIISNPFVFLQLPKILKTLKNCKNKMNSNQWVFLMIGGKRFCTTISTLSLIPYFSNMMHFNQHVFNHHQTEETPLQIDRNGTVFKHVLNCTQNPTYMIPKKHRWDLDFGIVVVLNKWINHMKQKKRYFKSKN